jgi:hypothetical protein
MASRNKSTKCVKMTSDLMATIINDGDIHVGLRVVKCGGLLEIYGVRLRLQV